MNQKLYAFWSYDKFPYCLWGEVSEFKGDCVYIKSYQGWFKPFKLIEGKDGEQMIQQLKNLQVSKNIQYSELAKKFNDNLNTILPEVFKH